MPWHYKPAGIPGFPNDTAQDWADEWFTPITANSLNNLKDNLEYRKDARYWTFTGETESFAGPGGGLNLNQMPITFSYDGGLLWYVVTLGLTPPAWRADFAGWVSLDAQVRVAPFGTVIDTTRLAINYGQNANNRIRPVVISKVIDLTSYALGSLPIDLKISFLANVGTGTAMITNPRAFLMAL